MQRRHQLRALALLHIVGVTASCSFDQSGNVMADATSTGDATGTSTDDATTPTNLPIGRWTFDPGQELLDTRGNFPDLVLNGSAEVTGGMLTVDGSDTNSTGWAITGDSPGLYAGPPIVDKTLVSWITLEQLQSGGGAYAGSAITIDRESSDHFDGLIFGEREVDRWMSGSSNFSRTADFSPGFQESMTGIEIMIAITYDDVDDMPGGTLNITGYRNGVAIGSYSSDAGSSWSPGDAEILFGTRHGSKGGGPGALDALINEARIYDNVLSAAEIEALVPR